MAKEDILHLDGATQSLEKVKAQTKGGKAGTAELLEIYKEKSTSMDALVLTTKTNVEKDFHKSKELVCEKYCPKNINVSDKSKNVNSTINVPGADIIRDECHKAYDLAQKHLAAFQSGTSSAVEASSKVGKAISSGAKAEKPAVPDPSKITDADIKAIQDSGKTTPPAPAAAVTTPPPPAAAPAAPAAPVVTAPIATTVPTAPDVLPAAAEASKSMSTTGKVLTTLGVIGGGAVIGNAITHKSSAQPAAAPAQVQQQMRNDLQKLCADPTQANTTACVNFNSSTAASTNGNIYNSNSNALTNLKNSGKLTGGK